ncbi:MAG: AtpZ/AtpI family protein [Candidatus Freyarchaeota archaeon]
MSSEPFERLKEREKKRERWTIGNIGKWIVLGSELPIMVIAGIFIGYYLGERFGAQYYNFFVILGAVLGFLVGTYNIIKIVKIWEKRGLTRKIDGKSLPPPKPSSIEPKTPGEIQKKDELSDDEKWERVLRLMKLNVNLEDDKEPPFKDDKFEE